MKRIRWPFWAAFAAGGAAWLILGFTLPYDTNLNDVFNVAALAAFAAAAGCIAVYTAAGVLGPAKWWRTNVGTYLILAAASVLAIVGPTAWAVLFHHGVIDTWWLAWAYIGGHFLAAAMWAALAWLWLRNPGNGGAAAARIRELEAENEALRARCP